MIAAWVIGSGGLLGSALSRQLRSEVRSEGTLLFSPRQRFSWNAPHLRTRQIAAAVEQFAARLEDATAWEIYWAAGIGTMRSCPADLIDETNAIRELLMHLGSSANFRKKVGTVGLASSAGAIYAGSRNWMITEESPPAPTTAYAHAKLEQESLIQKFAASRSNVGALALRLSTLYGPGQAQGKPQGLLTHIARSIVLGRPIQIYVPLDTVRDYIAVDDAAVDVIRGMRSAAKECSFTRRIISSEQPTTISEILSVFRRVAPRPPRIVTSAIADTALYGRRAQFRSIAIPRLTPSRKISLMVGASQVLEAELARYARSVV